MTCAKGAAKRLHTTVCPSVKNCVLSVVSTLMEPKVALKSYKTRQNFNALKHPMKNYWLKNVNRTVKLDRINEPCIPLLSKLVSHLQSIFMLNTVRSVFTQSYESQKYPYCFSSLEEFASPKFHRPRPHSHAKT